MPPTIDDLDFAGNVSSDVLLFVTEDTQPPTGLAIASPPTVPRLVTKSNVVVVGLAGNASDNLAELNRLTAAGVTLEGAAKQTWTGQRALNWLFMQVQVLSAVGWPGSYSLVLVLFTR